MNQVPRALVPAENIIKFVRVVPRMIESIDDLREDVDAHDSMSVCFGVHPFLPNCRVLLAIFAAPE